MLLAIDPGARSCGVALFDRKGRLVFAGNRIVHDVCTPSNWEHADKEQVQRVVIEMPQTYRGRAGRGDANDLIAVARVVGMIQANWEGLAEVKLVLPRAWKATVRADLCCRRAWAMLLPAERKNAKLSIVALARLASGDGKLPDSATHPLDAIGLGLVRLGRALPGLAPGSRRMP